MQHLHVMQSHTLAFSQFAKWWQNRKCLSFCCEIFFRIPQLPDKTSILCEKKEKKLHLQYLKFEGKLRLWKTSWWFNNFLAYLKKKEKNNMQIYTFMSVRKWLFYFFLLKNFSNFFGTESVSFISYNGYTSLKYNNSLNILKTFLIDLMFCHIEWFYYVLIYHF